MRYFDGPKRDFSFGVGMQYNILQRFIDDFQINKNEIYGIH